MSERSCQSPSLCIHAGTYPEKPCYECRRFAYINLYQPDYWQPRPEAGYGIRPGPGRKHPDDEPEVEKP